MESRRAAVLRDPEPHRGLIFSRLGTSRCAMSGSTDTPVLGVGGDECASARRAVGTHLCASCG